MYPRYQTQNGGSQAILKSPPMFAIRIEPILVGNTDVTDFRNVSQNGMLPGFITSFGISYDVTKGTETSTGKVPREITLSISFSPLHDRMGGFDEEGISNTTGWPF